MSETINARNKLAEILTQGSNESIIQKENLAKLLNQQKRELEETRHKFEQEQINKERKFQEHLAEREEVFLSRENALRSRSLELERRAKKYELEINILREQSTNDRLALEVNYKNAINELAQEKKKYQADIQERIEGKASEYVNQAIDALKTKEIIFFWTSFSWSIIGGFGIAGGLVALFISLHDGAKDLIANKEIGWMLIIFLTAKSAVLLGVMFAFAKYSMMFSKSYMHESLRNIERQHAINFGKFYLGTYGANASWENIKSVFEHWNISRDSTFLSPEKSVTTEQSSTPISWSEAGETAKSVIDAGKRILTPEKQP